MDNIINMMKENGREDNFRVLFENKIYNEKLVTAKEVSEILSIAKSTAYLWAKVNKIPSRRIGNTVRFPLDEIMAIVHGQRSRRF